MGWNCKALFTLEDAEHPLRQQGSLGFLCLQRQTRENAHSYSAHFQSKLPSLYWKPKDVPKDTCLPHPGNRTGYWKWRTSNGRLIRSLQKPESSVQCCRRVPRGTYKNTRKVWLMKPEVNFPGKELDRMLPACLAAGHIGGYGTPNKLGSDQSWKHSTRQTGPCSSSEMLVSVFTLFLFEAQGLSTVPHTSYLHVVPLSKIPRPIKYS